MKTPADYDAAIAELMKHMPAGPAFDLAVNALRAARAKAEKKIVR